MKNSVGLTWPSPRPMHAAWLMGQKLPLGPVCTRGCRLCQGREMGIYGNGSLQGSYTQETPMSGPLHSQVRNDLGGFHGPLHLQLLTPMQWTASTDHRGTWRTWQPAHQGKQRLWSTSQEDGSWCRSHR